MKKSKPAQNPGPGEDVPALLVGRGNPAGFSLAGRKAGERTTLPSSYRLELCQELIEEAMKCLGNSDKERTMKLSAIFTRFTKPPRAAPREGGCVGEGLKSTPAVLMWLLTSSAYLLGWIIGDGGLYKLNYSGGRTEYRVVVTQKDLSIVMRCLVPLFESLCSLLNVASKVRILTGSTRVEVRVSSKRLYEHFTSLLARLPEFTEREKRLFIAGFYMAEGEKSGRRVRMWNKNKQLLELLGSWLKEFGIEKFSVYLDDKRHGVYVLEISNKYRHQFFNIIYGVENFKAND